MSAYVGKCHHIQGFVVISLAPSAHDGYPARKIKGLCAIKRHELFLTP